MTTDNGDNNDDFKIVPMPMTPTGLIGIAFGISLRQQVARKVITQEAMEEILTNAEKIMEALSAGKVVDFGLNGDEINVVEVGDHPMFREMAAKKAAELTSPKVEPKTPDELATWTPNGKAN